MLFSLIPNALGVRHDIKIIYTNKPLECPSIIGNIFSIQFHRRKDYRDQQSAES